MTTICNIDQLGGNAQAIIRFSEAALKYGLNIQVFSINADIFRLVLVHKSGSPGGDFYTFKPHQIIVGCCNV